MKKTSKKKPTTLLKSKVKSSVKKPAVAQNQKVTPVSTLNSSSRTHTHHTHIDENMYICMNDITLKRKYILQSLKSSLVLQEEQEKVMQIRAEKLLVLNEIKKEMESINLKYQSLKKLLPNVKNVISYTEKELGELDSQIDFLKKDVRNKNREIEIDQKTAEDLNSGMKFVKSRKYDHIGDEKKTVSSEKVLVDSKKKNMTKIERIQNNLKVIESKLKGI